MSNVHLHPDGQLCSHPHRNDVCTCVLWWAAYTKLMMSSSLETLYRAKPPGRCSGLWCLVCVEPATCLILWITSSSVGVVTGLRASSRCWLRMWGSGLFLRLTVEFFTTFAFGDSWWVSMSISSSLDSSNSERGKTHLLHINIYNTHALSACWKHPHALVLSLSIKQWLD